METTIIVLAVYSSVITVLFYYNKWRCGEFIKLLDETVDRLFKETYDGKVSEESFTYIMEPTVHGEKMRLCRECGQMKPVEDFDKGKVCKECRKAKRHTQHNDNTGK